jgi:uncharacterized protein (TIGR00369 family)
MPPSRAVSARFVTPAIGGAERRCLRGRSGWVARLTGRLAYSLHRVHQPPTDPIEPTRADATRHDGAAAAGRRGRTVGAIDGVTEFMGLRWDDAQTVRLTIRPELINAGGLLSGVATYALVDYCMGSTLWAQTTADERIATINISVNYVQTATSGEIVCRTTLDRRNRRTAVMRSEVVHEDGRLLVTAIGSYTIFPPRGRAPAAPAS